ncbi:MAG: hypothetical protein ACR2NY_04815 [Alphaproteobacteria bacterium]
MIKGEKIISTVIAKTKMVSIMPEKKSFVQTEKSAAMAKSMPNPENDMLKFYEEKLLAMAESLAAEKNNRPPNDIDFARAQQIAPHIGKKHSRLCGSVMTAAFWLNKKNDDMVLTRLLLKPQSCLLGRTAAALCETLLIDETLAGVKLIRGLLHDLLIEKRHTMPKPFTAFNCFTAVRYLQNRHSAILLPLDVVIETWQKDLFKHAS